MGFKSMLKKASGGAKKFFTKDTANVAQSMFKKVEDTAQMIKKEAPGVIDTALRKTSNTLKDSAPIVGGIGKALQMASPALAGVPGIGIGLSAGGMALGTALSNSQKSIKKTGQLVDGIRNEVKRPSKGIEAKKPENEPINLLQELPFY